MKSKVRTRKPKYQPLVKLPPLPPDQYEALRQNIAVNGVLVPILVDGDGAKRRIIDGNNRKNISDELGYDCPEVVHEGDDEDLRTLARALNLARRQLTTDQKRQVIADQLQETPRRTNRWVAKMLGVSHPTVASVRAEMESVGKIYQQESRVGSDGKAYKPRKGAEYWAERPGGQDEANPLDFHPTPASAIAALVARERFNGLIWEPAAGNSAIVRVLKQAGYKVRATDLTKGVDFLHASGKVPNVVTNPPYADGRAESFCRHALTVASHKVAMLVPIWFLEGVQRHDLFTSEPLKAVYVFSRRPTFGEDQESHAPFGTCWIVWDKRYKGKPHIEWLLD